MFIFDDEVEPILQVLCGKTLEHSKMEVLEEEELRYMEEEQKHFKKLREEEIAEAQKLESIELRKKQEIERRKQQQKVKKLEKIAAHKKFTCRQIAKKFFAPMTSHALVSLKERGGMVKDYDALVYEDFIPWLYGKTQEFLIEEEICELNNDKLLRDVMLIEQMGHHSMIDKEHKRLDDERIDSEKAHEQKLYEKDQRRLEREHKRREEELKKLKEDINQKFIQGGESVEGITSQEVSHPNAELISKNIVGAVGGPFVQIALVLSVLKDKEEEVDEFFNKKSIAQFLITYVISNMKPEQFSVLLDKHIEEFMKESDQPLEDVTKLSGPKAKAFRELMKDRENGMLNRYFRYFNSIATRVGINLDVFQMFHDVLADVISRKQKAKEGVETKQEQFLKKINITTVPEEYKEENVKAVVKIKIPMIEKKDEDSEEASEQSEENSDEEAPPKKKKKQAEMIEAPLEDKVQLVNPRGEEYNIMVLHQAGGRLFRKEIISSLKKLSQFFEDIDVDEISAFVEETAKKLEDEWISSQGLPVFEFELN